MSGEKDSVTVEIYGQEYKIKGEEDGEYMAELARHVDKRMKEVAKGIPAAGSLAKISILAALNIADELFRERDEKRRVMEDVETTTRRMRRKLEEIVP